MKRVAFLLVVIVGAISAGVPKSRYDSKATQDSHLQILLVVAHPDDEYDMAATVYRITTELHGVTVHRHPSAQGRLPDFYGLDGMLRLAPRSASREQGRRP